MIYRGKHIHDKSHKMIQSTNKVRSKIKSDKWANNSAQGAGGLSSFVQVNFGNTMKETIESIENYDFTLTSF